MFRANNLPLMKHLHKHTSGASDMLYVWSEDEKLYVFCGHVECKQLLSCASDSLVLTQELIWLNPSFPLMPIVIYSS